MIKKIILIVGSGRVGSTWVLHWLLENPEIFGFDFESNVFLPAANFFITDELVQSPSYSITRKQRVAKIINKQPLLNKWREVIFEIFNSSSNNRNVLVEQTPRSIEHINFINEILGGICNVYFIHLYRDGRNVVESASRQGWVGNNFDRSNYWNSITSNMLQGNFPGNMINIKFEDLVEKPETSILITKFCGIEHHKNIVPFEKKYSNGIMEYDKKRYKKMNDDFSHMEIYLKKLGYEI